MQIFEQKGVILVENQDVTPLVTLMEPKPTRRANGPNLRSGASRPISLTNTVDCRRFLSKLVNNVYRGEINSQEAARVGYLVGLILRSLQADQANEKPAQTNFTFSWLPDRSSP